MDGMVWLYFQDQISHCYSSAKLQYVTYLLTIPPQLGHMHLYLHDIQCSVKFLPVYIMIGR